MSDESSQTLVPAIEHAASVAKLASRRGRGFLTVCFNVLLPGLGFWIIGLRQRAVIWFVIFITTASTGLLALWRPSLVPALIILFPLSVVLQLILLVDSYRMGRNSPRRLPRSPLLRYAVGCAVLLISFLVSPSRWLGPAIRDHVEAFSIPFKAMMPALRPGDRFLAYKGLPVRRWDVVVYDWPAPERTRYCLRVVGLPGEQVELVGGKVYVNGHVMTPPTGVGPYDSFPLHSPTGRLNGCEGFPIRLGPSEYYLLGDSSSVANDSRFWNPPPDFSHPPGALPADHIIGRATWIYWPISHWRRL